MLVETIFWDLVDQSNIIFKSFDTRKFIIKKGLKYFSYDFEKSRQIISIPKVHKWLYNLPGRPGTSISNRGPPIEKASEFLDFDLKPLM